MRLNQVNFGQYSDYANLVDEEKRAGYEEIPLWGWYAVKGQT